MAEKELAQAVMACIIPVSIYYCIQASAQRANNGIRTSLGNTTALLLPGFIVTVISIFVARMTLAGGLQQGWLILMLVAGSIYAVYKYWQFINRSVNKKATLLFTTYLIIILYITLFSRAGMEVDYIKLDLLYAAKRLFVEDSIAEARHLALNIALFIPMGLLFPLPNPHRYAKIRYFTFGILLSAWIESIQLLLAKGECDVADIFGNSLGMLIGILLIAIIVKVKPPTSIGESK